jgi:hypothetical protein
MVHCRRDWLRSSQRTHNPVLIQERTFQSAAASWARPAQRLHRLGRQVIHYFNLCWTHFKFCLTTRCLVNRGRRICSFLSCLIQLLPRNHWAIMMTGPGRMPKKQSLNQSTMRNSVRQRKSSMVVRRMRLLSVGLLAIELSNLRRILNQFLIENRACAILYVPLWTEKNFQATKVWTPISICGRGSANRYRKTIHILVRVNLCRKFSS